MTLSEEVRDQVIQDFFDIFQSRYGDEWRSKLTTNLRPSPIRQIAEQRGITVSDVKKVRSQLLALGQVIRIVTSMTEATPEVDTQEVSYL